MLAALGVVMLWIGSVIEVMDASMAVLASLFCVFAVIEYGKSAPWLVFCVTSLLSLILLPQKLPAVLYALFFGYYPILKEKLEQKSRVVGWIWKEGIFHVALAVILVCSRWLLMGTATQPLWYYGILVVLAEVIFPIYDLALTRLISFYVYRLRSRLRIGK